MKRKILSVVLCIAMLMSIGTIGIKAEFVEWDPEWDKYLGEPDPTSGQVTDTITWEYDKETRTLTLSGTGALGDFKERNHPWRLYSTMIKKVVVEEGITSTGKYAFASLVKAEEYVFPSSLTEMGEKSFYLNKALRNLTLPAIETVPTNILGITTLENLVIPEGVKKLEDYAFKSTYNLKTVVLPSTLEEMAGAFAYCGSLESVVVPDGVKVIGNNTFRECNSLKEITLPEGIDLSGFKAFFGCDALCDENNFLIIDDILLYYSGEEDTVVIPDGVKAVYNAFRVYTDISNRTRGVKTVIFPDSVTDIGNKLFKDSKSIHTVVFPKGLTEIGEETFYCCTNLEEVVLPEKLEKIGANAFNCASIKKLTLTNGIKEISAGVFSECIQLEEITIGENVEIIAPEAFAKCTALTNVYYLGNSAEWDAISIDESNEALLNANITFEELLEILGDVDGDGEITAADALMLKKYCAGITGDINIELADAFEDGMINAKDLLMIRKLLAQ